MIHYICSFLLHRREAGGDSHLLCRVKWDNCRSVVSINVGIVIDPAKWDSKMQRCVPRSTHGKMKLSAQSINNEIERYTSAVEKVMSAMDGIPTAAEVRKALRLELCIDTAQQMTTAEAWDKFFSAESVRCAWADGTVKTLKVAQGHILSFEPFLSLDGFTEENLARYVNFLRETRGINDVTIHRHLGYVRWFLKWCHERKLVCDDYVRFRPKLRQPQKPVIFLEWSELMKVWEYQCSGFERRVLDEFLFSCFTSLRYSDVQSLKWSDVGEFSIRVVTQKTSEALTIELNEWSQELLSRYIDVDCGDDHVFPQIPNQSMNRTLKELMCRIGIDTPVVLTKFVGAERTDEVKKKWELIGTHCGRRTFICNALMLGISPNTVMQWTGHNDYKAMRPYIAIADSAKAEAMKLFNSVTP